MLMKRTHLLLTCLALLVAATASAQGPNNSGTYYQDANGKKGAELKTALCGIIRTQTNRGNKSTVYGYLWNDFKTTDVKENGKVWDMYSIKKEYTFGTDQAGNYSDEGDKYNREHSWPKSWFNDAAPMYHDLFHLYPTDGKVNGMRSNYPFGETTGENYTLGGKQKNGFKSYGDFSKLGLNTYPGYEGIVFEPNDIYKGDFARTYFYMVTCYENEIVNQNWYNNTEAQPTIDGSKYPAFKEWQLNMLLEWATKDPVDNPIEKETPRNNAVYGIQGNRNPFIDYPGLEQYIWGTLKEVAFSYDNYQQPAAVMTVKTEAKAHDNVMYNMAGQVVDKSYKGMVIMNGKKFWNK